MRRARALSAIFTLLVGVTLQTAQAAPLRTAQLRAQSCCAGKCHGTRSLGRAMQCCRVPQEAGPTIALSPAPSAPQPVAVLVTSFFPAVPVVRAQVTRRDTTLGWSRAGPIYLQTQSLLL